MYLCSSDDNGIQIVFRVRSTATSHMQSDKPESPSRPARPTMMPPALRRCSLYCSLINRHTLVLNHCTQVRCLSIQSRKFKVTQSKKWYVLSMFFVCFLSELCFLHVCGNGWDQKHVLCMFYVCSMYVCMFYVCFNMIGSHSLQYD